MHRVLDSKTNTKEATQLQTSMRKTFKHQGAIASLYHCQVLDYKHIDNSQSCNLTILFASSLTIELHILKRFAKHLYTLAEGSLRSPLNKEETIFINTLKSLRSTLTTKEVATLHKSMKKQ